ncbi:hypothetical protein SAMN05428988_3137 [Chitinophaga sp. YR573]|uniref:hypothetical protein n=1 Tax=Chitinophaga sp. YR573 TaxID=1881040 RepID=UPI0008BCA185|nr:hypothetical protein [Chitinophaga sp. YR573]SEW20825.1 hypothetical protein SAMN05428988_3137 [Chitinophaga sp. YR573]
MEKDKRFEDYWNEFLLIPVVNGRIQLPFYQFEKGSEFERILEWLNEKCANELL